MWSAGDPARVSLRRYVTNCKDCNQSVTRRVPGETFPATISRVAVRDQAIRIPPAQHKKIFERFYRVGSGLVESRAHRPWQQVHHQPSEDTRRPGGRTSRILIVEDDRAMSVALRDGFEFEKHDVVMAATARS